MNAKRVMANMMVATVCCVWLAFISCNTSGGLDPKCFLPKAQRTKTSGEPSENQSFSRAYKHPEVNSVYYWKTSFALDSVEWNMLKKYNIKRIYLRMFDVVADNQGPRVEDRSIPNATVRIPKLAADGSRATAHLERDGIDIVPVVYITLDALKEMKGEENLFARKILERVRNMCKFNGMKMVSAIQLDCDWTQSTEVSFFDLCRELKNVIRSQKLKWATSSTIRLHQLSRAVPPVDYGVLMVYNTGSFANPTTRNSIIDPKEIKPYLKNLSDYKLHLDVAYPTYSWQLLFRDNKFVGLLNNVEVTDTTYFYPNGYNVVTVKKEYPYNDRFLHVGDEIRTEESSYDFVSEAQLMIEKHLASTPHSNVIYHLDSKNLSKYSDDEIKKILPIR